MRAPSPLGRPATPARPRQGWAWGGAARKGAAWRGPAHSPARATPCLCLALPPHPFSRAARLSLSPPRPVEIRGGPRNVKATTSPQRAAVTSINWNQDLTL